MVQQQRVSLEERMARLEGVVEGVDRRLDSIERRLNSFEDKMERRLESLDSRLDNGLRELRQRQDRFFWMIFAVLLPMWVTIILAIVART